MEDGDIFFWRWKNPENRSYHCRSRMALVKDGVLRDTFWSGTEGALRLDDIKIEYQGNSHEMSEISEHTIPYYRSEDIVDMRHGNSSMAPVYLRAGAGRDYETMRAHARYLIERSEGEIRMAKHRIERLNDELAMIDAHKLDKVYL